VAMVDGGFDPLHHGHVAYFAAAARLGVPVLCNISADDFVVAKHPVLLPQAHRALVIDAIRHVDLVHCSGTSTVEVLRQLQPLHYVKGDDWRGRLPAAEVERCEALGIEIVYVETVLDSSTEILRRQRDGAVRHPEATAS